MGCSLALSLWYSVHTVRSQSNRRIAPAPSVCVRLRVVLGRTKKRQEAMGGWQVVMALDVRRMCGDSEIFQFQYYTYVVVRT